jgi:hypothetical protein
MGCFDVKGRGEKHAKHKNRDKLQQNSKDEWIG